MNTRAADSIIQTVVMAAPTSLGNVTTYLRDLTAKAKPFHKVVTRLTLKPEDRGGYKTSIIMPEAVDDVPAGFHAEHVKPLVDRYRAMLRPAA